MKGIIYKWTCNKSGKSYIGQTINESRREKEFLSNNEIYTVSGSKIDNARKKYGVDNGVWKKDVLKHLWCKDGKENELLDRLNFWERYYIEKYDTFNNGYNSTDGGSSGFLVSDETRNKLKKIGLSWWNSLSNEEKEKSKYWLGKNFSSTTCESIRKKHIGSKKSEETKNKIRESLLNNSSIKNHCKPIRQYDLDGNFIKEYYSVSEASKINNIRCDNISRCARGLQKKSGGYVWKFSNEKDKVVNICENKGYYFHKRLGKYKARLRVNRKEYNLGFYRNENAASAIYKLALKNKDNIDEWFKNIENEKQNIIKLYDA